MSPRGGLGPPLLFCPIDDASPPNLYCHCPNVLRCQLGLASWWLVRSSDGKCLVVDIEPKGKDKGVSKIGKDVYQSAAQAELDSKRLCKEA